MHNALSDTIILLAISVITVALFRRIKLPAILAYLAVGVTLGPHAANVVSSSEPLHFLADIGIAFLLFSLGLEFSLNKLMANSRSVIGLGSAQVTLTLLLAGLSAWLLGANRESAFVIGCIIALSSTAIVVKQLGGQLEIDTRHGNASVSILLFQDIAVVPMLVIIPAIAGEHETSFVVELTYSFATGISVTFILLAVGRWLLRPLFHEVAAAHSAELFTLTVLLVALLSAWATDLAGLSMALGAFLAGMMLSETEFKHQIENDIRPFRDIFLGLFFISVGMMVDIHSILSILHWALLLAVAIIIGKTVLIMLLSKIIIKLPTDSAMRTGLVLGQGGEFGFAIMALALHLGLLQEAESQIILTAIVITMIATPFLIKNNGFISKNLTGSYTQRRKDTQQSIAANTSTMDKHVIICGFGGVGQNIAKILEAEGYKYFALDFNIELINHASKAGYKVSYGDSTQREILLAAGIKRAAILAICHDSIGSAEKTLRQAKLIREDIPVLIRTKDDAYYDQLCKAGATEVIPETLESSLIMASHVLHILGMPMTKFMHRIQEVREDQYASMREFFHGSETDDLELPDDNRKRLSSYTLNKGDYAIGKKLVDLELDKKGISLHKSNKHGDNIILPNSKDYLKQDDILVLYGTPEDLEHIEGYLLNG